MKLISFAKISSSFYGSQEFLSLMNIKHLLSLFSLLALVSVIVLTPAFADYSEVTITPTSDSESSDEHIWTESTNTEIMTKFVPEFGTITMMMLIVAIIGIIAVTAKSRIVSGTAKLDATSKPTMGNAIYKLSMIGIIAIIIFGISMAVSGYNSDIYPLDRIRGHFDGIVSSSDPLVIRSHLLDVQKDLDIVMERLPETTDASGKVVSKNPVWIFATESTNFIRIQNDVDSMLVGIGELSSISKDNAAYHTGMLDINERAMLLKTNIMDATPYMYVSPANMMFSVIWIAAVIGIFAVLKRKKEQFKETDEIGV